MERFEYKRSGFVALMIDDPHIQVPGKGKRPISRRKMIMSGQTSDSQRQAFRFRTGIPAEFRDDGQAFACEAHNISRNGVLLVGEIPVPSAQPVEFSLTAPAGNLTVRLSGRIIRVGQEPSGGGLAIALEFVDLDDAKRDELELLLARILEAPAPGPLEHLKPSATPQEIKKALESIPLPQRMGLATRAAPRDREFLRLDTHPAVLEALARNPSLTVAEARALATSAYLMPGTLDALSNDVRFRGDDEIRMAIAVHPRVSMGTAERVTANFKAPQLKKLLAKPGLNQRLREKLFKRSTTR
jgi:PilZ domain